MDRRAFSAPWLAGLLAAPLAAEAQPAGRSPRIGFSGSDQPSLEAIGSAPSGRDCANSARSRARTSSIEYRWREGARAAARPRRRARPPEGRCHRHAGPRQRSSLQRRRQPPSRSSLRRWRPGRQRPGREPGAAGRQRHRLVAPSTDSWLPSDWSCSGGRPRSRRLAVLWQYRHIRRRLDAAERASGGGPHAWRRSSVARVRRPERSRRRPSRRIKEPRGGTLSSSATTHLSTTLRIASRISRVSIVCRRCMTLREFVEAGGLLSYGAELPGPVPARRRYVDRILKGAKPADLPVEQPPSSSS